MCTTCLRTSRPAVTPHSGRPSPRSSEEPSWWVSCHVCKPLWQPGAVAPVARALPSLLSLGVTSSLFCCSYWWRGRALRDPVLFPQTAQDASYRQPFFASFCSNVPDVRADPAVLALCSPQGPQTPFSTLSSGAHRLIGSAPGVPPAAWVSFQNPLRGAELQHEDPRPRPRPAPHALPPPGPWAAAPVHLPCTRFPAHRCLHEGPLSGNATGTLRVFQSLAKAF